MVFILATVLGKDSLGEDRSTEARAVLKKTEGKNPKSLNPNGKLQNPNPKRKWEKGTREKRKEENLDLSSFRSS